MRKLFSKLVPLLFLTLTTCTPNRNTHPTSTSSDITVYISQTWTTLTRSPLDCRALIDPKLPPGDSLLYLPADQPLTPEILIATKQCNTHIQHLPPTAHPGLLYLPNPYVVPGGRFNEMYGWDSYFILEGLLESHGSENLDLAKGMTENFFYELSHYGAILNANRTYYLTRSQPPFLTSMILDVEKNLPRAESQQWLEQGYDAAQKDWSYWNQPALLAGDTRLSRYFDFGTGPVPEMHDDPTYYQTVITQLLHRPDGRQFLREATPADQSQHLPTAAEPATQKSYTLTDDFYLGDRALRASGFDITHRFGPFGAQTHHFAPVCLNSLLYKEESDLAQIARRLNKAADAQLWQQRAQTRKAAINRYLWNDSTGMFFDYDFTTHTQSTYPYATTFYPLWTKLASASQAQRLTAHLRDFLLPGGLATSTQTTGLQWDAPFAWAPLQLLAAEGLRNYGYTQEANDLSQRWLSMIQNNFHNEHTLREKYNAQTLSPDIPLTAGYTTNVAGFGWTNATYLKLQREMTRAK